MVTSASRYILTLVLEGLPNGITYIEEDLKGALCPSLGRKIHCIMVSLDLQHPTIYNLCSFSKYTRLCTPLYNSVPVIQKATFGLFILSNCYQGIENMTLHNTNDTENFLGELLLLIRSSLV